MRRTKRPIDRVFKGRPITGTILDDRSLFRRGEPGAVYDPSDLDTLFQDSTGGIPVTAVGQPVGLMLDARFGEVRGPEILQNGDFGNPTGWTLGTGWSISSGKLSALNAASNAIAAQYGVTQADKWYEVVYTIDSVSSGGIRIAIEGGWTSTIHMSPGSYRAVLNSPVAGGLLVYSVFPGTTAVLSRISARELPGNHAFQSITDCRPLLQQNPLTGAYYLETDGVDDWMKTGNIDLTSSAQATVFAGVRKLRDSQSVFAETSANADSNNGAFYLQCPADGSGGLAVGARGVVSAPAAGVISATSVPGDQAIVWTASVNLAGATNAEIAQFRVGGEVPSQVPFNAPNAGGTLGNYPLYLFRRGGVNLPFKGHFYGAVILGRAATGREMRNLELEYAGRMGVGLA